MPFLAMFLGTRKGGGDREQSSILAVFLCHLPFIRTSPAINIGQNFQNNLLGDTAQY